VPLRVAVLAVSLLATETAAPTPTKPPAPEIARLSMAGVPSEGVRVPDSTVMAPRLLSVPADMAAELAPPSWVMATPALTPAYAPTAMPPALLSADVLSRLVTVTDPAVMVPDPNMAEVMWAPLAPPKAALVS